MMAFISFREPKSFLFDFAKESAYARATSNIISYFGRMMTVAAADDALAQPRASRFSRRFVATQLSY